MDDSIRKQLAPGAMVEVIQQIPHRDRTWVNRVRGVVISFQQRQTGSWYAHSKDDKLWLDRLKLRCADGEIITLVLDDYTHIDLISAPKPAAPEPAEA